MSNRVVHVADEEAGVVGHHGFFVSCAKLDGPLGVYVCGEVGASGVTNEFASGVGEGVAVVRHSHNPIVAGFFIDDGGGQDFVFVSCG